MKTTMISAPISDQVQGVSFPRGEEINCPLCGAYNPSQLIQARFGMQAMIAECLVCRVAYQSPRPSLEASVAYMNWRWQSSDAYVASKHNQLRRARVQLNLINRQFSQPGRLLDFGSGAGSFVYTACQHGWNAMGVEISASARQRAKLFYNIDLLEEIPKIQFDVVTLWDVIEHLPEPLSTLNQLKGKLAPGGWIILETGNYESWLRLAEKQRWGLYLFDHQFYFSPISLKIMLEKAGYSDFQLLKSNRTNPWTPRFIARRPDLIFSSWKYWWAANKLWSDHSNIHIMLASANKPTH